ncbi:hypothetical protein ISM_04135 [Roseovarius nubinhibens ISM]|uniref:Uncharacterized protein n=2 Tax=Roseovarius nubinhibens TaxID=314263 RepID=A3SJB9_ROSNI|nr:hypothetical protein ISM_04135 [Roseovarius nubinhibens ISM]
MPWRGAVAQNGEGGGVELTIGGQAVIALKGAEGGAGAGAGDAIHGPRVIAQPIEMRLHLEHLGAARGLGRVGLWRSFLRRLRLLILLCLGLALGLPLLLLLLLASLLVQDLDAEADHVPCVEGLRGARHRHRGQCEYEKKSF